MEGDKMSFTTLQNRFTQALEREGYEVTTYDGAANYRIITRREVDKKDSADWISAFFPAEYDNAVGRVLMLNDDQPYLVVAQDGRNNEIYRKFNCVRCNQVISFYQEQKSTVPDEFGVYGTTLVLIAETPCYVQTSLSGLLQTANVQLEGGKIYVTMPAVAINTNTTTKLLRLDSKSKFVDTEVTIESTDVSDCYTDASGAFRGLMRLQLKP
jgi:hypothetical protein